MSLTGALWGLFAHFALASTTGILLPSSDGNYAQWTPNTGTTHYTLVDDSACNGTTDYNSTGTIGNRDSYGVNLTSVVNGATITQIDIVPCASRSNNGTGSATLDVFYRFNGANSSDSGSYALSGTTPTQLATTTFASVNLLKTSTSTLEIGAVLSAGNKGARLSRIATVLKYEITTGVQMTSLPPDVSLPTGSVALTVVPAAGQTIAFDAASSGGCSGNCGWSHAVSGANRGLLVFLTAADTCTYTVLYDNTPMTEIGKTDSFGSVFRVYAYKMENPATSATAVYVTSNPSCTWQGGAVSYQGVNQTNMVDVISTHTNFPGVASVTTTPAAPNGAIVSAHGAETSATGWTPGNGQIERVDAAMPNSSRSITVTDRTGPNAPSGLTAVASSADIVLSWSDNSANENGFSIERSADDITFTGIATTTLNVTSYTDVGAAGAVYYYRVRAFNDIGYSGYSNTEQITASVVFDAASSGGCSGNCGWSHTVSGSNRGLLVFLTAADTCTYSVLYNNTPMTEVAETDTFDSFFRVYAYKMENPATSATGVSVSSNPSCTWQGGAVSYRGVNQTNMVDTVATSTNPAQVVASVTSTPTVASSTIVSAHGEQTSSTGWTPGNGQTERVDAAMPNSSRSITVTELFSATAGIAIQMTSTPPDFSMPTGSLAVSLKPF